MDIQRGGSPGINIDRLRQPFKSVVEIRSRFTWFSLAAAGPLSLVPPTVMRSNHFFQTFLNRERRSGCKAQLVVANDQNGAVTAETAEGIAA
jgi:hypothetical protein